MKRTLFCSKSVALVLALLFLFSFASPFDDISYGKFAKLKITSFKIITRETVRVHRTDTMPEPLVSGYRIVEYNFPVSFIPVLFSHPAKLDTVRNGSPRSGCIPGWGYGIFNGRYKAAAPCGFDIFKKTLTLTFTDSAATIQARYSLKKIGEFLKQIAVSDTATEMTYDSLIDIQRGLR